MPVGIRQAFFIEKKLSIQPDGLDGFRDHGDGRSFSYWDYWELPVWDGHFFLQVGDFQNACR